jgi:8-oxo-dGTP diphosphatase
LSTNSEVVHAAVAVLQRADGQVLLGQRPEGKPWAGWWEFPGGKIEDGETAFHALGRELHEELGIEVTEATPWLTRSFDYPERTVKLHFFMVRRWRGEPHGKEGQRLSWQNPASLTVDPMLPANTPILAALQLPDTYAISNLAELGEAAFMSALEAALKRGLRLIQWREKHLPAEKQEDLLQQVLSLANTHDAKVLLNGDVELAVRCGVHGVHLPMKALMALHEKPAGLLCGASCHNADELAHAAKLGLDFVVLSPVLPTRSHPGVETLGWHAFKDLVSDYPLPVYALGGMHPQDLQLAWEHGAHGIAMQRAVWE